MDKGLTEKVLEILSVATYEGFYTKQGKYINDHRFNSTLKRFEYWDKKRKIWAHDKEVIDDLLTGKATLIKKPWEPIFNEEYFYFDTDYTIFSHSWEGDLFDLANWQIGNCFKSEEEAKENKDRVFGLLTGGNIPMWKVAELGLGNE